MRISVFGLGYVGTVSAACLAQAGHTVIGVDSNPDKVAAIAAGRATVIEADVEALLAEQVAAGRLGATGDAAEAVARSELSLICVGTPSRSNGSLDLTYIRRVAEEIGHAIAGKPDGHLVVLRSTVLPGTLRGELLPLLEAASGRRSGDRLAVASNPEFMREGTAVADFHAPPKTVIGADDPRVAETVAGLYAGIEAPLVLTSVEVAEMIKYADNAWHALKVGFANEVGNVCKALGVDGHAVMEVFCRDRKLNLSPYYLKPGFAFGGSCLPKDVRALTYRARSLDVETPILSAVLPSNRLQMERGLAMVTARPGRRVGMLGFSFKAGTDDLRESPLVELAERLLGKGYDLRLYDRNVSLSRLIGANRDFLYRAIPHIAKLMVGSVEEVLAHAETIVIGNGSAEFHDVPERLRPEQAVIDLVRIVEPPPEGPGYDGICW